MNNPEPLTPNQKLALESIPVDTWFAPDEASFLRLIQSRTNTCKTLAKRGILLTRVRQDFYFEIEYQLPTRMAIRLKIQHRETE